MHFGLVPGCPVEGGGEGVMLGGSSIAHRLRGLLRSVLFLFMSG